MKKLINGISLIAIIFILIVVNSCTKDNLVSNDSNTAIQKWNHDGTYPFVLPKDNMPYQYAIYQNDKNHLFEYIRLKFESIEDSSEKGYFILSFNVANARIYYGFITRTSSYYNSDIWTIFDESNNDDAMCFTPVASYQSDNFEDAQAWATKQMEKGYTTCINYDKKTKTYLVIADDGK